jgi:hypothetical protein
VRCVSTVPIGKANTVPQLGTSRNASPGLFLKDSHFTVRLPYTFAAMLYQRTDPAGFIAPCLPTKAPKPPTGQAWLHEIKHDGFRVIARKDGDRVRLYSRPGNDLTDRFPLMSRR